MGRREIKYLLALTCRDAACRVLGGEKPSEWRGKAKSSYATRRVPTFSGDKFYIVSKYLAKWCGRAVN